MVSIKLSKSKIIDYYNNSGKIIEVSNLTTSYKNYLKAEEDFLKKTIPERANILEIGAGQGRIIDVLNNGKRKITGIEIANASFLKNRYKHDKNITISKMDAHKLVFRNDSFDFCLIMYNTLGLMYNPLKVLKECKKIVGSGGKIVISTYTTEEEYVLKERMKCFTKLGHKIIKVRGLDFEINKGIASHYFKEDELKKLFKDAKLKTIYYHLTKLGCIWTAIKV